MKKFIKNNLVLALGISLPIVLVLLFAAASTLPGYFIAPPRYDFLFTESSYGKIGYEVKNGKLIMVIKDVPQDKMLEPAPLYRYHVATGDVTRVTVTPPSEAVLKDMPASDAPATSVVIPIDPTRLPTDEQAQRAMDMASGMDRPIHKPIEVLVNETQTLSLENSKIAPDGYRFEEGDYHHYSSGLLFTGFGGGSYERSKPVLAKGGKRVRADMQPYIDKYDYPEFLGWIVP